MSQCVNHDSSQKSSMRTTCPVSDAAAYQSLPDYLRDPTRSVDSFRPDLKTLLFSFY